MKLQRVESPWSTRGGKVILRYGSDEENDPAGGDADAVNAADADAGDGDAEDGLSNERLGLGSVIVDLAWIVLITHLNHTPNPTLPTSLYHSTIVQYMSLMNTTFVSCFKHIEEMVSSCNQLRSDELCRLKCGPPSSHKDV